MAKRSSEHIKAQKDGKDRDFRACQICGSTDNPQGHHIIDVKYKGAASVDNIITLCDNHHKKVHSKKIDIVKF